MLKIYFALDTARTVCQSVCQFFPLFPARMAPLAQAESAENPLFSIT